MLNEVLGSVVSGRPTWRGALSDCASQQQPLSPLLQKQHEAVQEFIAWDSKCKASTAKDCLSVFGSNK